MQFDPPFEFVTVVVVAERAHEVVQEVGDHSRRPPRMGDERKLRRFVPAERRKERRERLRVIRVRFLR